MPKALISENAAVDPSLLALKPRQVLLANPIPMKKPSGGKASSGALTADQKTLLLQSVAHFLDRNGFCKTLKKFRSEAHVEKDGLTGSTWDLEEIFHKYLDMWVLSNRKVNNQNEQDTKNDDTSKRDEEHVSTEAVETGSKKSKSSEKDNCADVNQSKARKKSKKVSESLDQGTEQMNTEISKEPAGVTACESDKKSKEKKEKKQKRVKSKDTEKQKDGPVSNSVPGEKLEDLEIGDVNGNHSKKRASETPVEDIANKKKSSKKRKISEENNFESVDKEEAEEPKCRKVEGLPQTKSEQPVGLNASLGSDEGAIKVGKGESGQVSSDDFLKPSNKKIDGLANGSVDKSGEKTSSKKTKKQENGSAEPKAVNAFRRVKAEEVEFIDERLKDNSYWAKDGAESGYGAKAQEILGQVRGRDFRHEKTKKKRGSYRGGQIDLQSHSVKFDYSDEE